MIALMVESNNSVANENCSKTIAAFAGTRNWGGRYRCCSQLMASMSKPSEINDRKRVTGNKDGRQKMAATDTDKRAAVNLRVCVAM